MGLELEIVHVFRSYNGNPILRDCSFGFASGRTYVLQGPNGSGKSTLFRALALLEKPDSGRVEYRDGGRILAADLALRRRITLVLPRTGIFNTTVFKNVAYGLKIRGITGAEMRRGSMTPWRPWAWRIRNGNGPRSFPAAKPSAWGLPGPW